MYLSACAIVKDEEGLPEWVAYHHVVGVEHFQIWDNGSKIPVYDQLLPWIKAGIVSVLTIQGTGKQCKAYEETAKQGLAEWTLFIDADEFVLPHKCDSLPEFFRHFEASHQEAGAIGINWRVFGASGHVNKPPGLTIENYVQAAEADWHVNEHVKTALRRGHFKACFNPHFFALSEGLALSASGKLVDGAFNKPPELSEIQVNHYFTKSREEYIQKIFRGSGMGLAKRLDEFEIYNAQANMCMDTGIMRFVPKVKALLGEMC